MTGEPGDKAKVGILPPRMLLFSLLVQLPLIVITWPPGPNVWEVSLGILCLATGAVLNIWAERLFRKGEVGVCPFSPVPRVVMSGPYRLTRNPMYLGFVLICAALALLTGTVLNLLFAISLWLWLHFRFVIPEERFLLEQLGATYQEYLMKRRRWL